MTREELENSFSGDRELQVRWHRSPYKTPMTYRAGYIIDLGAIEVGYGVTLNKEELLKYFLSVGDEIIREIIMLNTGKGISW